MQSVSEFLKRASDRNGFYRERFEEKKLPTEHSNIIIMPFFGDLRSMSIMSMVLLHRYRNECKNSKYFILASWPGFEGFFPYVDEYWSLTDESILSRFYEQSEGLRNKSDLSTIYLRNLNEFFRDVIDYKEILPFYNLGLTADFFKKFTTPKIFLPFVPSTSVLGKEFNRDLTVKAGYKVFIHPSKFAKQWHNGRSKNAVAKKDFWIQLCEKLLENNFMPVIWQNYMSYDISPEFVGRCIFVGEKDIIRVLSSVRATGCVLDVFNSLSRLSIMARCPFLAVDERSRYSNLKEYEIDDLCGKNIPHEYIYTFSTIITDGGPLSWNQDIFPSVIQKLNTFLPLLDRDTWPSTGESCEVISYKKNVRVVKQKKIGTHFIKIPKD